MFTQCRFSILALNIIPVAGEFMKYIISFVVGITLTGFLAGFAFFFFCLGSDVVNRILGNDLCKEAPKRQQSKVA